MSTYDLEEQEQLATIKAWWKQYGNLVLTGVTIALFAFAAWNAWTWYRQSEAAAAAGLYENLQKAVRVNDIKAARDAAGTILEKYSGTSYAPLAALLSAKIHHQTGDFKTTRAQLQWAIDHARKDELKSIARLRLAQVLIDEQAYDEALKTVDVKPSPGFEALFEATRGDVFLVQKKMAEARKAYAGALEKAGKSEPGSNDALKQQLQYKLDALGEG